MRYCATSKFKFARYKYLKDQIIINGSNSFPDYAKIKKTHPGFFRAQPNSMVITVCTDLYAKWLPCISHEIKKF